MMRKKHTFLYIGKKVSILWLGVSLFFSACVKDFLNQVPDDILSIEEIFNRRQLSEEFLANVFIVSSSVACSKGGNKIDPDPIESDGEAVLVATFNVAYDNANAVNEKTWNNRKDLVANIIKNHKFDIFGAQEPLFNQLEDIKICCQITPILASAVQEKQMQASLPQFFITKIGLKYWSLDSSG